MMLKDRIKPKQIHIKGRSSNRYSCADKGSESNVAKDIAEKKSITKRSAQISDQRAEESSYTNFHFYLRFVRLMFNYCLLLGLCVCQLLIFIASIFGAYCSVFVSSYLACAPHRKIVLYYTRISVS